MLAVDLGRFLQFLKRLGSDAAVVSQLLDLEHTPVGGEADLAERRQVLEASAHSKSPPKSALGDNARPASAVGGGLSLHLASED
jgi:hypothetical protein